MLTLKHAKKNSDCHLDDIFAAVIEVFAIR